MPSAISTDTVYLTNDTDIISSSSDTVVYIDLATSVAMTDTLALRSSVLTEHHTDPEPGFKSTDNTFRLSLVSRSTDAFYPRVRQPDRRGGTGLLPVPGRT